jgi:preprotein translocase subunit Sec63
MPEERMVKKVDKWKTMLKRPLGRPKNRWEDDIRNDMKKLKIKNHIKKCSQTKKLNEEWEETCR